MQQKITYFSRSSFLSVFVTFSLLTLISSCTIQKRIYRPGYSVNWKNVDSQSAESEDVSILDQEISTASLTSSESSISPFNEPIKKVRQDAVHTKIAPDSTDCDIIILENGTEIKANIQEIGTEEITYVKCGDDSNTSLSIKIDDVSEVKIHQNSIESDSRNFGKKYNNAKSEPLGIAGLVCSVIPFLFPLGGVLGIIFGAISLKRINREPSRYKGRGIAIASLAIGIAEVLLIAAVVAILILIW